MLMASLHTTNWMGDRMSTVLPKYTIITRKRTPSMYSPLGLSIMVDQNMKYYVHIRYLIFYFLRRLHLSYWNFSMCSLMDFYKARNTSSEFTLRMVDETIISCISWDHIFQFDVTTGYSSMNFSTIL